MIHSFQVIDYAMSPGYLRLSTVIIDCFRQYTVLRPLYIPIVVRVWRPKLLSSISIIGISSLRIWMTSLTYHFSVRVDLIFHMSNLPWDSALGIKSRYMCLLHDFLGAKLAPNPLKRPGAHQTPRTPSQKHDCQVRDNPQLA